MDRGLVHRLDGDLREPSCQRGLRLQVRLVLLGRRRADAGDLAAGQGRLERLAKVAHGRRRQQVDLVEEDDDRRVADLDEEVAKERRFGRDPRGEREERHVEDADVAQGLRDLALGDPDGQALHDRRLARAGRPEQQRVALRAPQQDLDDRVELAVAARIGPSLPSRARPTRSRPKRSSVGVDDARAAQRTVVETASARSTVDRPATIALAMACSSRSIALSGKRRLAIERSAKSSRTSSASSDGRHAPALGQGVADAHEDRPRGRPDRARGRSTVVNRRARASSRAIVVRYSSGVVAPMTAMSPRARAGFRTWSAPIPPSVRPAPARRWISSKNRMIPGWLASATSWATRSSSWPRYWVPAVSEARGTSTIRTPRSGGRHAAGDDPLRQPFDDRGLAHAGRSEQHRVALRAPDEDLDHPGGLVLAPDDRRERTLGGELGQVAPDLVEQRVVGWRPPAARPAGRVGQQGGAAVAGPRAGPTVPVRRGDLGPVGAGEAGRGAGDERWRPDEGGRPAGCLGELVEAALEPGEGEVDAGRPPPRRVQAGPAAPACPSVSGRARAPSVHTVALGWGPSLRRPSGPLAAGAGHGRARGRRGPRHPRGGASSPRTSRPGTGRSRAACPSRAGPCRRRRRRGGGPSGRAGRGARRAASGRRRSPVARP